MKRKPQIFISKTVFKKSRKNFVCLTWFLFIHRIHFESKKPKQSLQKDNKPEQTLVEPKMFIYQQKNYQLTPPPPSQKKVAKPI